MLSNKRVIIMAGYPGSGKSTLAKQICNRFGHIHLSSDQVRLEHFQQKRYDDSGNAVVEPKRTDAYKLMYQQALKQLAAGRSVVLDATHVEPAKWQQPFSELIATTSPKDVCFILVNQPKEVIAQRMSHDQHATAGGKETFYESWQRVYGYFEQRAQAGLISWPDSSSGVEIFTYADILSELD